MQHATKGVVYANPSSEALDCTPRIQLALSLNRRPLIVMIPIVRGVIHSLSKGQPAA